MPQLTIILFALCFANTLTAQVTATTTDNLNRVVHIAYPNGATKEYAYDNSGNIINIQYRAVATTYPLRLVAFDASQVDKKAVQTHWRTENEIGTKDFEVERSTDGGLTFQKIGTVPTKAIGGNSNTPIDYDFLDEMPQNGFNYYRLKMNDLSGVFTYSNVEVVEFEMVLALTIYPNPTTGIATLLFSQPLDTNGEIDILSSSGQILGNRIAVPQGSISASIDLSSFPPATYLVRVWSGQYICRVTKIVKHNN